LITAVPYIHHVFAGVRARGTKEQRGVVRRIGKLFARVRTEAGGRPAIPLGDRADVKMARARDTGTSVTELTPRGQSEKSTRAAIARGRRKLRSPAALPSVNTNSKV
jgi:hypothetical protein